MSDDGHSSVVGGSSAGRVLACPPSRLSGVREEGEESEFARMGTLLHTHMEQLLLGHKAPITDEMLPHLWKIEAMWNAWSDFTKNTDVDAVAVEARVGIPQIPGAFGTVDVLFKHKSNRVTVWDWKTGEGVQVEADSDQLRFYAAAALYDPQTRHMFNSDTEIDLVICQPNNRGLPVVRVHPTNVLELFEFIVELKWAVDNGDNVGLLNSGDHCRWCPMKVVCPKLEQEAQQAVTWMDPHEGMDLELLAQSLEMIPQLEMWIKANKDYAHEAIEHGKLIPRHKLVARQARTSWVDEEAALRWLRIERDAADYEMATKVKLNSVAAVNKLVDGELPEHLFVKKSSGTVVVPSDDKRAEVPSAAQMQGLADQIKAEQRRK